MYGLTFISIGNKDRNMTIEFYIRRHFGVKDVVG